MHLGVFAFFENPMNDVAVAIKDQIELIRYAESLGMQEAWLSEHHFNPYSVAGPIMPLMGYALAATRTMTIGSAAVLLPYHAPLHVAEAMSTLDILSDGRVAFGIAKGAFPLDNRHFKADPETNDAVMREAMQVIDRLLTEGSVTHRGTYYDITDATLVPKPVRPIPRFLATFGSEASIVYAAQNDMGLLLSQTADKATIQNAIATYKTHSGGKKPVVNLLRMLYIKAGDMAAMNGGGEAAARFASAMRGVKSGTFSPLRESAFDAFPMSKCGIVGSPERCRALMEDFRDLGVDGIMLRPAGKNLEENKAMLDAIKDAAKGL